MYIKVQTTALPTDLICGFTDTQGLLITLLKMAEKLPEGKNYFSCGNSYLKMIDVFFRDPIIHIFILDTYRQIAVSIGMQELGKVYVIIY